MSMRPIAMGEHGIFEVGPAPAETLPWLGNRVPHPIVAFHSGVTTKGFQIASGIGLGRPDAPKFKAGTLSLQKELFRERGFDFERDVVGGCHWGTINVRLPYDLELAKHDADFTFDQVDWSGEIQATGEVIGPENFSFVRCVFRYDGRSYEGYIYTPRPSTKPDTNGHDYAVLEILCRTVSGFSYNQPATVICRADSFRPRDTEA